MGAQKQSDQAAHALFPSDAPKAGGDQSPAGDEAKDAASLLFKDDQTAKFDDRETNSFFDTHRLSAIKDGDSGRADEIKVAQEALVADMKAAGTSSADFNEALSVVRDRMGALVPPSSEQIEADFVSGMAAIQQEGISDADLNSARAFIRDLEVIAPGTIATLEHSGAGNDLRLVRKAVAEAKRRGYR
ncbi:hypothetical protein AB4144_20605 [Rhizobiaceae sp. 2RAB30]